jgi:peptide/nickel transport system substrate-binding protein
MKKFIFIILVATILITCGRGKDSSRESKEGKGGVFYGGVFRMNETDEFQNLFPLSVTLTNSPHIVNQIYEGLVKLSQSTLSIEPCLAEKWEINGDATQWVFHIRKGVKFHNDVCFKDSKGREITANDFKYSFEMLCTDSPENNQFLSTFHNRVAGADTYYQSTVDKKPLKEGVLGIKVIDDYTLQINLTSSFVGFLNILTSPGCFMFPKEAVEKYGIDINSKFIGTGAFQVKNIKSGEGDTVVLERNPNYWNVDEHGNALPFLDELKFTFIKDKKIELREFKKGNLDMIYRLPVEAISNLLGDIDESKEGVAPYEMQVIPAMSSLYYSFGNHVVFAKKEVRLAFNFAINREKIVNYTLQGEGLPGIYGIIPPCFKGYDNKALKSYVFDVEKARTYLAEAGYPNGKGFPTIALHLTNGNDERTIRTAEIVKKMLKENLNIDIEIIIVPLSDKSFNEEVGAGNIVFWSSLRKANYPDPENFLALFYNKSNSGISNSFLFNNPKFDSLYEASLKEVNDKKRYDLYRQAEQLIINDAPIMPIFYDESYRLIHLNIKNFPINAMEYRNLSKVYFTPPNY